MNAIPKLLSVEVGFSIGMNICQEPHVRTSLAPGLFLLKLPNTKL